MPTDCGRNLAAMVNLGIHEEGALDLAQAVEHRIRGQILSAHLQRADTPVRHHLPSFAKIGC